MDLFLTSHKRGGSTYLTGSIGLSNHQSLFYLQSERDPVHKKQVLNSFALLELLMMHNVHKAKQN
jgi:hypothetical protein